MKDLATDTGLTGIIPFTYFGGLNSIVGSTSLRVENLVNSNRDFEKWKHGHKYDNLIFQKVYWKEMMELFKGTKILDLCDPDWLSGDVDIIDIGSKVDAITCSSKSLTTLVRKYFPNKIVEYVPDRFDFSLFPEPKQLHIGKAQKIVWFGFINNAFETLEPLSDTIKENNLELTIISNRPYDKEDKIMELNPIFINYERHTIYTNLKKYDISLNPKSAKAQFKYKSNNKTIIAWKLGLPVAETAEDLIKFLSAEERNKEVAQKQTLLEEYHINKSSEQYREIIQEIKMQKNFTNH